VKTNHFPKQQCADTYEFSVVYKVFFSRILFIVSQYVSVHIYVMLCQEYSHQKLLETGNFS